MKQIVYIILLSGLSLFSYSQAKEIKGIVLDEKKLPVPYANLYIEGTMDGTSSGEDGTFVLETEAKGEVTLVASFIGYTTWTFTTDINNIDYVTIEMKPQPQAIKEVVAYAGNYLLKSSSTLEEKNAVDLVMTAGSEGDLYNAIALLPGTQVAGVDGRLLVRGGDSRESQTFIDGMHVLHPYTESGQNNGSRGRFSPFLFDGINFSMGGYSPEYTQSLSSVLPLTTKDVSTLSKLGLSIMNVGPGGGGTKSWDKGSLSFNGNYTDMRMYYGLTEPGQKKHWKEPYRSYDGQSQLRFQFGEHTYFKTFVAYDKSLFNHYEEKPFSNIMREFDYNEDNLYLNSTFKTRFSNNVNLFAGAAYSWNKKKMREAVVPEDALRIKEDELHVKTKASKRFSNLYKLEAGIESFVKNYDFNYSDTISFTSGLNHHIDGLFLSNDFNLTDKLFLNLSSRLEYTSLNDSYIILPRLALNYEWKGITMSGVIGKYQQNVGNDYLLYNKELSNETNWQYLLGWYYQNKTKIFRLELYHKEYDKLPTVQKGKWSSDGHGYSRGIDLFFNDRWFLNHWEYMVAYSFNDSKRKYLDYPEMAPPSFTTKHNASITIKYVHEKLRSIVGFTNRFASGKPYHNPNKDGFMNEHTPFYHTMDLSLTILAHKKLIFYACFSNLLNRKNTYGYNYASVPDDLGIYADQPIRGEQSQTFYIGFFLTLGKNVAYESSNF